MKPTTKSAKKRCAHCGKKFESSRPLQRFCSVRCLQTNYRLRNPEKIRARQKAWALRNRPRKQPKRKACATCSKPFETADPQKRFCSEKCRDADHYKRHRPRYLAYTRKWRRANPEKCRQQCRRYYAKHRTAENLKTRLRYAEKKRKLAELERIVAQSQQPEKRPPGRPSRTEVFIKAKELHSQGRSWPQCADLLTPEDAQENRHAAAEILRVGVAGLKSLKKSVTP
jgi:endogenous inhibitor of DNA gyrase (YacG/DUF329 family)